MSAGSEPCLDSKILRVMRWPGFGGPANFVLRFKRTRTSTTSFGSDGSATCAPRATFFPLPLISCHTEYELDAAIACLPITLSRKEQRSKIAFGAEGQDYCIKCSRPVRMSQPPIENSASPLPHLRSPTCYPSDKR